MIPIDVLKKQSGLRNSSMLLFTKKNNAYLYFSGRQPTFNLIFACALSVKLDVRYAKCGYEHIVAERKKKVLSTTSLGKSLMLDIRAGIKIATRGKGR